MANINKIRLSGTTYNIEDENASRTVELTQAQYDALQTKDPNTYYVITDAKAADITNYYDKTETDDLLDAKADTATTYTKTEIDTALAAKADTATTYTKTEVDTALATKQATLVSGTNIKTINNESILGSGNITIQGGGGATYTAGTNISIDTANTINCTLPITISNSVNGDKQSIAIGDGSSSQISNFYDNIAIGKNSKGYFGSIVIGSNPTAYTNGNGLNVAIGNNTKFYDNSVIIGTYAEGYNGFNANSIAIGAVAKANNIKGAVAIGYDVLTSGTTKMNLNNQIKVDTNNQVYIKDKDNVNEVCIQDAIAALGGLKLVKISQADYDVLATKDENTLYIITDAGSGGGSDWEE